MSVKPKQRVVLIDGAHSFLMKGDPNPEGFEAGKVLPAMLAKGWQITNTGDSFVVLEKRPDDD
jgi:hypothetical protein